MVFYNFFILLVRGRGFEDVYCEVIVFVIGIVREFSVNYRYFIVLL